MGGYIGARAGTLSTTVANVTGDVTVGDDLLLNSDSAVLSIGADADLKITHDGTNGDFESAGNLTFDVAGDLIIDVDGGDVKFKDDGTEFSQYYKDGNDLAIYSSISDGDIKFQGKDGGSVITPVTIDMSEGGKVGIAGNTAPKESLNSGAIIVEGDHATGVNAMGASAGMLLHATGDTGFVSATSSGSNNRNLQLRALNSGSANANQLRFEYTGNVGIGCTALYMLHVEKSQPSDFVSEIRNSSGTNPYGQIIRFSGAANDGNTQHFFYCTDVSAVRLVIDADGDVRNHDNSYGAISDERVKEQISDATSQWDDIKGLTVRKFKLKDDVRQYGNDAKFKLGLISQETELVSPNLIQEVAPDPNHILSSSEFGTLYEDGDDIPDGKEIGDVKERKTTVKGIRYSILYMKAVKALQEAMARIETLETKVAALEAE